MLKVNISAEENIVTGMSANQRCLTACWAGLLYISTSDFQLSRRESETALCIGIPTPVTHSLTTDLQGPFTF